VSSKEAETRSSIIGLRSQRAEQDRAQPTSCLGTRNKEHIMILKEMLDGDYIACAENILDRLLIFILREEALPL